MRLKDFLAPVARDRRRTVAVAMAQDPDIIKCIADAMSMGLARFALVGERDSILALAEEKGVDVTDATFVEEPDAERACARAAELVHAGDAHIPMKGLVATAVFLSALLDKRHGLVPPGGLISHVGLFDAPAYHKPLIITDAGVNIAPSVDDKARILMNAVEIARRIGIDRPKVACVAPIEVVNPRMQSTVDADELRRRGEAGAFGDAIVDGPLDLHIAVSRDAARVKGRQSAVAGDPDVILLSSIEAANVCYKCLTQFAGGHACSVIAGMTVPVVCTSRTDDEQTRLLSIGLAAHMDIAFS